MQAIYSKRLDVIKIRIIVIPIYNMYICTTDNFSFNEDIYICTVSRRSVVKRGTAFLI